jgi:hypothetical protein
MKNEDGKVNMYVKGFDHRYGPYCKICNTHPDSDDSTWNEETCTSHYMCPICQSAINKQEDRYCKHCGIKFDWSEYVDEKILEENNHIKIAKERFLNDDHVVNVYSKEIIDNISNSIDNYDRDKQCKYYNMALRLLIMGKDNLSISKQINNITDIYTFIMACADAKLI